MSLLRYLQKKIYGRQAVKQSKSFYDQWYIRFGWKSFSTEQDYSSLFSIQPPHDRFYADPFPIEYQDRFYIFFEEYEFLNPVGYISVVEVFKDGSHSEIQPVIKMPYHLSYPCLFWHENTLYMLPETSNNKSIELWKCVEFPYRWEKSHILMDNLLAADTTPFFHQNTWFLFTSTKENVKKFGTRLDLFWSDDILSNNWHPHPLNPVKKNLLYERPAGYIIQKNHKIYRPVQDSISRYGGRMELREITHLSRTEYREKFVSAIEPDQIASGNLGCHTLNYANDFIVLDAIQLLPK